MKKKMTRAEEAALEAYPSDDDRDLNFRRKNYRIAYERGYVQAEKDIIALIDSLQQEQPSLSDNLDEAAREIVIQLHPSMEDSAVLGDRLTMGELVELVKAGAKWMAERYDLKLKDYDRPGTH